MPTSSSAQVTDFTRDVLGRYICNGLDEANASMDRQRRPDARPFNIIVIGGGTFGPAIAEHLWFRDQRHRHRILVLEAGPFVIPEHVQNLPVVGLGVADATSVAELRTKSPADLDAWRKEVWGLSWHSNHRFPGLAYCLGGRSLYWGGWSPELLDAEMVGWPPAVVTELKQLYFKEAGHQIGVTQTNDFIFGDLLNAMRLQLYTGLKNGKISGAIAFGSLPDHPAIAGTSPTTQQLLDLLGLAAANGASDQALRDQLKLEAPLAVQGRQPRAGFFPLNKFSAMPLLMKAAREAQAEAEQARSADLNAASDDVKKRLMVVPNCHVSRLLVENGRVTRVFTNLGEVPVAQPDGVVIIALGTVESTRLALNSFQSIANYDLIGRNLMAHLRSNLTIRFPRTALASLNPTVKDLQAAALFVKGRYTHQDGTSGHFHLQITAAGLEKPGSNSEAELFKKIPDLDTLEHFRLADDRFVVVTIRGIGEMEPRHSAPATHNSRVVRDPNLDSDFGSPRAFVVIEPTAKDMALWTAMDRAADDVAQTLAGNMPFETIEKRRDGLGTTHHEAGTLWMGTDPSSSVTNPDGAFHHVRNAYVAGPAVFPTIGSPNPMLTGIGLGRRLGDQLTKVTPVPTEPGFTPLFDGESLSGWRMSTIKNQPGRDNPGRFIIVDGALEAVIGTDIGLLWHTKETPPNFILKLEWRRWFDSDNSGVFVRFPNPESKNYNNTAFVAVDFGFEVQIDQMGAPDGAPIHRTGAIYGLSAPSSIPARAIGEWNDYEIRVTGQSYTVLLNGQQINSFQNTIPNRGVPSAPNAPSFIGFQTHTGRMAFRNIRLKALP